MVQKAPYREASHSPGQPCQYHLPVQDADNQKSGRRYARSRCDEELNQHGIVRIYRGGAEFPTFRLHRGRLRGFQLGDPLLECCDDAFLLPVRFPLLVELIPEMLDPILQAPDVALSPCVVRLVEFTVAARRTRSSAVEVHDQPTIGCALML